MSDQTTVRASYRYVHGEHFFTSPEAPGLCAVNHDIGVAYDAVGTQLATLMGGEWMPREQFPHNQAWPIGEQLVWVRKVTRDAQERQNPPPSEDAPPQPSQGGCPPSPAGRPHRLSSPQEGEAEIMTDDAHTETTDVREIDIAERLAFYSREMPKRGAYLTAEIMELAHREIMRLREALDDITRGGPTVDAVIREDWQAVAEWQRQRAEEALGCA